MKRWLLLVTLLRSLPRQRRHGPRRRPSRFRRDLPLFITWR